MKSNLTESQHIRQMLESLRSEPPLDPPDYDETDYSEHPHVTDILEPIKEQQKLVAKLQKLSQKDPERALGILGDKPDPIEKANPVDQIDSGDKSIDRYVEDKAEQIFDKYEDTVENLPEEPSEVSEYLQTIAVVLEELDNLIVDMADEIGSAAAQRDADFDAAP